MSRSKQGVLATIVVSSACLPLGLTTPESWAASALERQRGKAGLYLRLAQPERQKNADYFFRHPLVDAVVVTLKWSELEPADGRYEFTEIDRMVTLAKRYHKGLVVACSTYGQIPENQPTPDWLYDKGVKRLTFPGGGVAKGNPISVPKVWEERYLQEYAKLIQALGARYAREPSIWYIMPGFGHTGNLNAQPSKEGTRAFLSEGWTPAVWKAFCLRVVERYQEAFPNTPLLVKSAKQLLREKRHRNFSKEADEILNELAARGVSIISFGLEANKDALVQHNVIGRIASLSSYAVSGSIRVGVGDDWPLWVPAQRRKKAFLSDRDEAGLARELQYAFGGVQGLPASHISILYVLHPEIDASHPEQGPAQNKTVYQLLEAARARLKADDPIAKLSGR